jgi:hypothetical protein
MDEDRFAERSKYGGAPVSISSDAFGAAATTIS